MPLLPGIVSSSTSAQVALPTTGDPHWNNVILLLNYNNSTTTTDILNDSSGNVSSISNSSSTITTPSPALGAAWGSAFTTTTTSQYCSYVMSDNSLWEFTGALTIEFWIYITSHSATSSFVTKRTASATTGFSVGPNTGTPYYVQGTLYVDNTARQVISDIDALSTFRNAWHHVAFTRDSSGWIRLFIDGVLHGKSDAAYPGTVIGNTANFLISRQSSSAGTGFAGKMDDVRVTRNVCRYGSDDGFSVPTEPFWYPT